jgi:hypothetical protein
MKILIETVAKVVKPIFSSVLMLASLSACTTIPDHTTDKSMTSIGSETFITWPADQSHIYISMADGKQQSCRSPQPDFATNTSVGGSLSLGLASGTDAISDNDTNTSTSLGGISPAVLIVREVLFRNCELTMNMTASSEKAEELFFKSLEILKDIVATQTQTGTSTTAVLPVESAEPEE